MVLTRTPAGSALLASAAARGDVVLEAIRRDGAMASHHHLLTYKKRGVQVRRRLAGVGAARGYPLPPLTGGDRIIGALYYALLRLGSRRWVQRAIGLLPLRLTGWLSAATRGLLRRHSGDRVRT
jgi:hypothetical protein